MAPHSSCQYNLQGTDNGSHPILSGICHHFCRGQGRRRMHHSPLKNIPGIMKCTNESAMRKIRYQKQLRETVNRQRLDYIPTSCL